MKPEPKDPDCPAPESLLSFGWLAELPTLLARYQGLGISPDIASFTLVELWGLYQWLSRMGG